MTKPRRLAKPTVAKPQRAHASKPPPRTSTPAKPAASKRSAAASRSSAAPPVPLRPDEPHSALLAAARRDAPEFFKSLEDQDETTHFITVDLEIGSRRKLDVLASELGPRMAEIYRGKIGTLDHANYEGDGGDTIDETIDDLLRSLRKLSPAALRQWRAAKVRDFNIGIQAGVKPTSLELTVSPRTMQAVSQLGGRLVITVYAYGRALPC